MSSLNLDRDVVTGAREKVDDGRLERIFLRRFVPVVGLVVTNPFHVVVVDTPSAGRWRITDRITDRIRDRIRDRIGQN